MATLNYTQEKGKKLQCMYVGMTKITIVFTTSQRKMVECRTIKKISFFVQTNMAILSNEEAKEGICGMANNIVAI